MTGSLALQPKIPLGVWVRLKIQSVLRFVAALSSEKQTARPAPAVDAGRLLDDYGNSILRMAYSYLHNMDDAEDILQETLLRCIQTNPTFENSVHEKAWLLRIAANLSKDRLRSEKLREHADIDELDETLAAEQRNDLAFVWDAVKQLPPRYREAVHLFYCEDCTVAQISKILNRKESSVRSDLHRGREKLKEILKEAYDFEPVVP